MRRVLVVEYLHADSSAFIDAPVAMRAEGRQMLSAVAEDLNKLKDVAVCVAVCRSALESVNLSSDVTIAVVDDRSDVQFEKRVLDMCEIHNIEFVLPIAPECQGILTELVRHVRHAELSVIAPDTQFIELCCDKWATFQLLQQGRLPTIPTWQLYEADSLTANSLHDLVVKPRDGVGCDGIQRLTPQALAKFAAQQSQRSTAESVISDNVQAAGAPSLHPMATLVKPDSDDFIVQPFISGQSYSVAVIGHGEPDSPIVLPVVVQNIDWHNGTPKYRGGEVPASLPVDMTANIAEIATTLANVLQLKVGYVGVDLLIPEGGSTILITEINPRLCTSYVGYRMATKTNLSALLLGGEVDAIDWNNLPVKFAVEG